jgi:hypothetical protein
MALVEAIEVAATRLGQRLVESVTAAPFSGVTSLKA